MDKKTARARALEQRDAIAAEAHAAKCDTICSTLSGILDELLLARNNVTANPGVCYRHEPLAIALYQAMKSEVSLACFIETVYDRGQTACFPCMMREPADSPSGRFRMVFRAVSREQHECGNVPFLEQPLRSFDCGDPALEPFPIVETPLLDMVVVPLVAFDGAGNRLGYGGGNYDRLLPNLRDNAVAIGVAFEEQRLDAVPCELHDCTLARIATA